MAKKDIFKESIIVDSFINSNIDERIKKILQEEKNNNEGNIITNVKGFQSKNILDKIKCESILKKTFELINNWFNFNYKLRLQNIWINENYKNCFNTVHQHPRCNFSGVYYTEVPEDSGELVFCRNDTAGNMMVENDMFKNNDLSFNQFYTIQPLKNQIVIFPSHLNHMVLSNNNEESRISVAFNLDLFKDNK